MEKVEIAVMVRSDCTCECVRTLRIMNVALIVIIVILEGYIDITGASPNGTPTDEELAHLNVICSKTQSALNDGTTSSSGSSNIEVPTISPVVSFLEISYLGML